MPQPIQQHFRSWVPRWLMGVVAIIVMIPMMLINGAYTGSSVDVSSYLGVMAEDINIAFFASSAGMAMAYPIIPIVKPVATTKTIILIVLFCQLILSFICAVTSYTEIIIICSFLIGYFKAFTLIEVVAILMPILSPSNTRNEFYSIYYPMVLILSQLSLVLTAEFAYSYQWQYMYYFMIALILVSMVAVVVCMQFGRRLIRIPIKDIDWLSFFQCSVVFMGALYVGIYGKTRDWFNSDDIIIALVLVLVMGWMFVRRQLMAKGRPFVDMSVLKNRNSMVVYLFAFIMMFMASYTTLISSYVNSVLRLDTARLNELYLYMIPGIIVGGFICYYWYLKALRMAWLIFIGFLCFTVAIGLLYFEVAANGRYEDLFLPMFLKGLGMLVLFVALAIYAIQGLRDNQLIYNVFFLIGSRSVLAPVVSYALLTNWIYQLQQKYTLKLSESVDLTNAIANSQYLQSYKTNLAGGMSIEDAQKMALNTLYNKVQIQSLTISIKEILGYMLIIGLILLVVILLYFFKYKPVRLIKVGRDMG
jgi:hypothetical protein